MQFQKALRKIKSAVARLGSFVSNLRDSWRKTPANDIAYTFKARSYPGSRLRRYLVHLPPGCEGKRSLPLVVVLHGCRQDNRDIEHISHFNDIADKHGFLVAYPFVTSYRGMRLTNCWGWWFDREIHRGAGEVEDLWQIIEEIKTHHAVDEQRIHVTGLSSGAAMTIALLIAHGDKIASGASVAGLAYNEKPEAVRHTFNRTAKNKPVYAIVSSMRSELGNNPRAVPLQIIHSEDDETVEIQSAKNLRDSWAQCFAIDTRRDFEVSEDKVSNVEWQHTRYLYGGEHSVIETFFIKGPGHGWYGGNPGDYSFPEAPDISQVIWAFFESHSLSE